jgi:hypothetical protein
MTASIPPALTSTAARYKYRQLLSEKMSQLSYTLFGPTTTHLQYEFYLLLSLTLLTVSSLQGLYKDSFGTIGDYCYLLLTTTWLSRHLLLRWLCMWDPSSSTHPTLLGFVSHFVTTHITGGQTFDRPPSALLVKQVGTPNPGQQPRDINDSSISLRNLIPPSILYLIQIVWIWICLPLLDILQGTSRRKPRHNSHSSSNSAYSNGRYRSSSNINNNNNNRDNIDISNSNSRELGSFQRFLQTTIQYVHSFGTSYGPTLQFLIPLATSGYYVWCIADIIYRTPTEIKPSSVAMSAQASQKYVSEHAGPVKAFGAYRKMEQPSFAQVWFYVTIFGTFASLIFFNRIALPIPEQVAGSNAIKDVRNEARSKSMSSKTRGSSNSNSSSGGSSRDNQDAVWTERTQSVQTDNRIRLTLHVALVRWLDNLLVCGILPRTSYACRATGHCPAGAQIWQLSKVLYPAGITSPLRKDGAYGTAFALLAPDPWSALWTILGVTMVTGVLLLAQTMSSNKSYLAIMGYICAGEWALVEKSKVAGLSFSTTPAVWDPRRKYKKGDLILYPPGSRRASVYRATSHSPEGRPYDRRLQAAHEGLCTELGHSGTSMLLLKASKLQLVYVMLNGALWIGYKLMGYPAYGLIVALAANLVAAHAVLDVGTSNSKELGQLNAEISPKVAPSQ